MAFADNLDGADLIDSATRSTRWDGFLFVPVALRTPDGWDDGVRTEPLSKRSTVYLPMGIQPHGFNLLELYNALWARARLPVALGFAPPPCRHAVRRQFLDAALLAVSVKGGRPQITPFICTDCELEAELRFGPGCPAARRRAVARAFWGPPGVGPGGRGQLSGPVHVQRWARVEPDAGRVLARVVPFGVHAVVDSQTTALSAVARVVIPSLYMHYLTDSTTNNAL